MRQLHYLVGFASLIANGTALSVGPSPRAPAPVAAAAIAHGSTHGVIRTERGDDGLFHLRGRSAGRAISFVVDTGASVTVLTAADAARLGARRLPNGEQAVLATAGGSAAMVWHRLPALEIAGARIEAVDVAVVQTGIGKSLLGQDILAQLGPLTITGDTLRVEQRKAL